MKLSIFGGRWLQLPLTVIGLAAFALSGQAQAHHAYAPEFGPSRVTCAEGTVTNIRWQAPHIQIELSLNDRFKLDSGYTLITLQSQAPSILSKNYELPASSVKVGDTLLVRGRPSVLGTNIFQMLTISINGSEELPLSTQGVPEVGELRGESSGEFRREVREETEVGADTESHTSCADIALY